MIDFYKASNLTACDGVAHGFFTRQGGISQGAFASLNGGLALADDPLFVSENRRRVCVALEMPFAPLLVCKQVHSSDVIAVSSPWNKKTTPCGDAMVTRKRGIVLAIMTGDCAPVLFADAEAGVIGAAHAGWRGALGGVLEETITMMERLGAKRGAIRAAVGPCIWQDSYEVSADFLIPFIEQAPTNEHFFKASNKRGHYQFDLPGFVAARLRVRGLASVEASPADTFANADLYYSYRRNFLGIEQNTGRQMSVIALR